MMQSVVASELRERQLRQAAMGCQTAAFWWHAATLLDERVDDVSGMHINCNERCQHTPGQITEVTPNESSQCLQGNHSELKS